MQTICEFIALLTHVSTTHARNSRRISSLLKGSACELLQPWRLEVYLAEWRERVGGRMSRLNQAGGLFSLSLLDAGTNMAVLIATTPQTNEAETCRPNKVLSGAICDGHIYTLDTSPKDGYIIYIAYKSNESVTKAFCYLKK